MLGEVERFRSSESGVSREIERSVMLVRGER